MSLVRRIVDGFEAREATLSEALTQLRGSTTAAGVAVSGDAALRHFAVWACVRLISESIAGLPVHGFRDLGDDREKLDPQPQLVANPSVWLDRPEWIGQILTSVLLDGNGYAAVAARDRLGWPTQAEVLHPRRVAVSRQGRMGPPVYRVNGQRVPTGDVLHIRGFTKPGEVVGLNPIEHARERIAAGLAAEKFSSGWFGEGGHPTAILKSDRRLNDEQASTAKRRFKDAIRTGGIGVLGGNWDYDPIQIKPADAAFIETQQWSAEQICSIFGVFPEMVGLATSGSSITYANREQRAQDFVQFTLGPWLTRLEWLYKEAMARSQYAKVNVDALLKADTLTRYRAHQVAILSGWRNANEVKELEDEPPIGDEGDRYLWPPKSPGDFTPDPDGGTRTGQPTEGASRGR